MIIFVITIASNKLENDMLSKGFQFSRNYTDFILMEQLVGQYLRFLHIVKEGTFPFRLIFFNSKTNILSSTHDRELNGLSIIHQYQTIVQV